MRYVGTRNPRAEHNPLRSMPLFRPVEALVGPSPTDLLIGAMRTALYARPGLEQAFANACEALGRANRAAPQWRRASQRDAMRALNVARAAMRKGAREMVDLEVKLLGHAVPADRWADAAAFAQRARG